MVEGVLSLGLNVKFVGIDIEIWSTCNYQKIKL